MTRIKYICAGLLCTLVWMTGFPAAPAYSARADIAEIKSEAQVDDNVITLGDLFDNLDQKQNLWVMDAPLPGRKTYVPASYLVQLTRQHGIYWRNPRAVRQVVVTRTGTLVEPAELKTLIQEQVIRQHADRNRQVSLYGMGQKIVLPLGYDIQDLRLSRLDIDGGSGKFTAVIEYPAGNNTYRETRLHGRLEEVTRVPALRNAVHPGAPITRRDITWITVPAIMVRKNVVTSLDDLIGMTPRRPLKAENMIRVSDLKRPEIVERGKLVNITYATAKMTLTVLGKAIESGGKGDVIQVMNTASRKTIDAVVTGPAEVHVIAAGSNLAALTGK
ncbi:flagellar basal body P-ring formation chaperone FlgA [Luteithermobacter gelatinilyticus]|uniref:flagellar basal body P-ring formation chaperone FlgA n=1 Tax=Luteithermobacter gelatinilyticus TaxID=2582913 RepID=UPI001106DF33|nr:flagellar basal body P-ring formation chaperone FlgA [Luteithermobacter gelatinilyticus]|tara:strand:+ start:16308 stop:17300 length:993 start_codon:yes stop_codon:yes gene_type:complete